MNAERAFSKTTRSLRDGFSWLCNQSPSPVAHLDEETQRRLVLRWAKEHSPQMLSLAKKRCPTPAELEKQLREGIICLLIFFFPLTHIEALKAYDFRKKLSENWQSWLTEADPDCDQWALEADIRRRLRTLPRKHRQAAAEVKPELDQISRTYLDLCRKRDDLDQALRAVESLPSEALNDTSTSLREQLQNQRARIVEMQAQCAQGLRSLRAHLALIAVVNVPGIAAGEQSLSSLHALNEKLSSTTAAAEEVLQLGRVA
jgi:hypothetical protein